MTAENEDDKRDKQQVFIDLVIFVWNCAYESFSRIDSGPHMIKWYGFLAYFGSLSVYFIAVSRFACGPNRVNAIDVIAVFPKNPDKWLHET